MPGSRMHSMNHVVTAARSCLHAAFSSGSPAILTVESGDSVCFTLPDVGWGLEPPTSTTAPRLKVEPRDPVVDAGPCLCGPIAVRGARPGDTLEIEIGTIRPGPWGWTYAGRGMSTPGLNAALGIGEEPLTLLKWDLVREGLGGFAKDQHGHEAPLRPFLGIIGLAPEGEPACGWTPRACGGNMDCRELVSGTTLYLPVMVEGAMLSVGDGHAAQGDGELAGTAIECAMEEAHLRLRVRRDMRVEGPRARTPEGWVTMGFAPTLDRAAEIAASAMLDLMVEQLGIPRAEALALASARVDLRITQMVNPVRGVHAVLRESGG